MSGDGDASAEVIALVNTETLRRVVGPGDYHAAIRILNKIAAAPQGDADELIEWLVREQIRRAKATKEKSDAKAAAIAAAGRRAGEGQ